MAIVTNERVDVFPNGTVVKAYPASAYHPGQGTLPVGPATAEGTMTSGKVEISGLIAGREYTLAAEVGGVVVSVGVEAPGSNTPPSRGISGPVLNGLLAQSFDAAMTAVANKFKPATAGTLYKARVPVQEEIKVSNVLLYVVTSGGTLTALENFLGLFAEGTRKLVAKATAAETIAAFEHAAGIVTVPLEAPVVLGPGYVDLGLYFKGTTAPELLAAPAATAAIVNASLANAALRSSSADTGLTTALPATMASAQTALASLPWVGLT